MKKVCILNGNMSSGGGTEKMTQILSNNLSFQDDFEVHVISMSDGKNLFFPLEKSVYYHTLPDYKGKIGMIRKWFSFNNLIKKINPDTIINVDVFLGIFSIPVKFIHRHISVISWEMFNIKNDMGLSWVNKLRKFNLRHCDLYLCQTQADANAFRTQYGIGHIDYIYNPYEPQQHTANYDTNSKVLLTAGHFFKTKGFDLAVEVARLLLPKHPEWKWRFLGDGLEFEHIKEKVAEYNLQNQIILAGRTKDMNAEYERASMYVMTSRLEGFGLVLLEAKSFNLPTISFDIPYGPAEIIENDISGKLIPAFDIQRMADEIEVLIQHPEIRQSYAENAKNNFEKFSLSSFINRWTELIKSVEK